MSAAMHDVLPEQYPTVIREMIRHENDLTNHRIMWLLIGQGFIANAYVAVKSEGMTSHSLLPTLGILVALSAYLMLYRSYQARGYLQFLGLQAKDGTLQETDLPLMGWPKNRIKDWWRSVWVCRWFRQIRDLFEPWMLLPYVFTSLWMTSLFHTHTGLHSTVTLMVGLILSAVLVCLCSVFLVDSQNKEDEGTKRQT